MPELKHAAAILLVTGLFLWIRALTRRRRPEPQDGDESTLDPQAITDLVRVYWDMREAIQGATSLAELSALEHETDYISQTFQGAVRSEDLDRHLGRLAQLIAIRRDQLRNRKHL
jgi:hypothetical protein